MQSKNFESDNTHKQQPRKTRKRTNGTLMRYPGGKSKFKKIIIPKLHELLERDPSVVHYQEPFFGGGSVGLEFLAQTPTMEKAWLNDRDVGVAALWTAVIQYPEELIQRVVDFRPSVEAFDVCKAFLQSRKIPGGHEGIVEIGFQNLALNRISYSGLGTKAGGPMGGRKQKSNDKIDSRCNPDRLVQEIEKTHKLLATKSRYCCSSFDFQRMIEHPWAKSLIYLDPPYYWPGNTLYHCGFTVADHERLAASLRASHHLWLLSYDDCSEIRKLYEWVVIEEIPARYSINGSVLKKDITTGHQMSQNQRFENVPGSIVGVLQTGGC